jgi:hypothetical protein
MVDRYGEYVCDGTILRVVKIKRMDRTTVVLSPTRSPITAGSELEAAPVA